MTWLEYTRSQFWKLLHQSNCTKVNKRNEATKFIFTYFIRIYQIFYLDLSHATQANIKSNRERIRTCPS